jgi:lipoprotein-releasing system permease protein
MRFEWMVARRYLRSAHRPAVLRLVTLLSVLGVAAGVATLVIALAMDTGFDQTIEDRLIGGTAHVTLTLKGSEGIPNYQELAQQLARVPGVKSDEPAMYETVLLSVSGRARGILIKGVEPSHASDEALKRVVEGRADFSPDADGIGAIVVGYQLADDFGLREGDYVSLIGGGGRLTPFGLVPRAARFRVAGIFNSGFYDFDANWGFVTMASAQALAGVGDVAGAIEFRIDDVNRAPEMAAILQKDAGTGFEARTWMQENQALYRSLHLEKLVTAIFVGLITFVAGLNILVVLTMTVTDRSRDIAVLMSMGARRAQVRGIFFLEGLAIGGIGTAIGLVLGYGGAWVAGTYRLITLDPEVYSIPFVPFNPSFLDGALIAIAALVICSAATLIPARAASRILPVEILRYE